MNYIDIAIVILMALFIFAGYQKGIIVSLLGLVRYVIGFPLCFIVSDTYALPVYNSLVRPRALEIINNEVTKGADGIDEIRKNIEGVLAELPPVLSNFVDLSSMKIDANDASQSILTNAFEAPLIAITKGIIFAIVFVVFFTITGLLLKIITKARKRKEDKHGKSLLSKTDRLVGAVFGFCKSFVTILAIASVLMYIQDLNTGVGNEFFSQIESSRLLPIIDEINPINYLIGG